MSVSSRDDLSAIWMISGGNLEDLWQLFGYFDDFSQLLAIVSQLFNDLSEKRAV
jgi:hypothetical protein